MTAPAIESLTALEGFVRPASVRMVGRFDQPDGLLVKMARYLRRHGFSGPIGVVGERADVALLSTMNAGLVDVTSEPPADLVVVAVRSTLVADTITQLGESGHTRAIILSSGFGETGNELLESELRDAARPWGMRLLGPNCQGIWSRNDRFAASFSEYLEVARPDETGRVAVVSQSGAVAYCLAGMLDQAGLSTAMVASTGNEVDIDWAELAGFAAAQDGIDTVLAYLEQITSIDQLRRANDAVTSGGARLAILKGGRTPVGTQAAASHTAAIASDGVILDHLCHDLGIALARDLPDLVGIAASPIPRNGRARLGVVSTSGGAGVIAADLLTEADVPLPNLSADTREQLAERLGGYAATRNPVDVTAASATDPTLIPAAWSILMDSGEVDLVVVVITLVTGARLEETVEGLATALAARPNVRAPLVVVLAPAALRGDAMDRLCSASIATFESFAPIVNAIGDRHPGDPIPSASPAKAAGSSAHEVVSDSELLAIFADLGLPVIPRTELAIDELSAATLDIPAPYVLKLVTAEVHKAAAGNVDIGPVLANQLESSALRLLGNRFGDNPPAVQVQSYLHAAVEAFLGVHRNPVFGVTLTIGIGGRLAEPLKAVRHWHLPVSESVLAEQLADCLLGRILAGLSPASVGELARLACTIGEFFLNRPDLEELDVNPVLFDVQGRPWLIDAAGVATTSV